MLLINWLLKALKEWKSRLHQWGYEPVFCSVDTKRGLDTLQFILREQTSVIVGPSGVGKSSLINALRGNRSVLGDVEDENLFEHVRLPFVVVSRVGLAITCLMISECLLQIMDFSDSRKQVV